MPTAEDRRIRALRSTKEPIHLDRPLAVVRERERGADGAVREGTAVFLAGRECPFTCVFCDLWKRTTDGPTPPGAIPRQIERALAEVGGGCGDWIKLYNASNFFDPLAVPPDDWPAVAGLVADFERVIVECHPALVGDACRRFSDLLGGRLEVALGLETAHPEALSRLNKRMTVDDFDRAAERLLRDGIDVRAFVLLGAPFVPPAETIEWTARSVEHAFDRGAGVVSLIPLRAGNGALEELVARGAAHPPSLEAAESAFAACLARASGAVQLDLWDLERLATCATCGRERIARLRRMNLTGAVEPAVACDVCGGSA